MLAAACVHKASLGKEFYKVKFPNRWITRYRAQNFPDMALFKLSEIGALFNLPFSQSTWLIPGIVQYLEISRLGRFGLLGSTEEPRVLQDDIGCMLFDKVTR